MIRQFPTVPVDDFLSEISPCMTFEEFYGNISYYWQNAEEAEKSNFAPFFIYLYSIKDEEGTPQYIKDIIALFGSAASFRSLDMKLLSKYGLFRISNYLFNFLAHPELNGSIYSSRITTLWQEILGEYGNKWEKLYDTLFAEYSPIENYNMVEDEKVGSKVVVSNENTYTSTGDQTNGTYGFDSDDAVPTNEGNTKVVSDGEYTTTSEGKFDDNHRQLMRHGNVGVTTNQTMAMQEIALRKNRIIDIIISDMADLLTRPQF